MSDIIKFKHDEFGEIRSMLIDNEPYFVEVDIARSLGHKNTIQALKDHCISADCKKCVIKDIPSEGGEQETRMVNESGLYLLIFTSQMPKADKFQDWICEEVLPSIRKTLPSYLIDY